MHRTRNAAYGQPYRGFESLPLRHDYAFRSSRIEELGTETFTVPADMTAIVTMRGVIMTNSPNAAMPVGVPAAETYSLARLTGKIKVMYGVVIKIVGMI